MNFVTSKEKRAIFQRLHFRALVYGRTSGRPNIPARAYPTLDSFLADIVQILREEVTELIRLGSRYIQIDAPHYGLLLDPRTRLFYERLGWTLDRWLSLGIDLDNSVMSGFSDVTFGFHI